MQRFLARYDFSRRSGTASALPRELKEVSGLATTPDGRLFAHADERAVVFELDPRGGGVVKAFTAGAGGIPGDYEGIAVAEDRIFLVTSGGELLEMEEGPPGSAMSYRIHRTGLGRGCEVEGLAYDPRERVLLIPCKQARARNLRKHLVVFSVGLDSKEVYPVPRVYLPWKELEAGGLGSEFHPSAIEVDPATGAILVLAGQEESLVELSPGGQLRGGVSLSRKDHPQPEGLAVLPDGTLLIADEGKEGAGRLTRYRPAPPPGGGGS